MNPAVLNYLQSQQGTEQEVQEAPSSQPQGGAPFNPFDSGIKNAIESARVSLDMTEKQQDKALRRSLLTFANNYGNEPKQKGFLANFGSVSRALSPAIMAHDDAEDMAFKENNALANQILSYKAAEQERRAREEEKLFRRSQAQEQLAEQKRYHNMMSDYQRQKLNLQQPANLGNTSPFGEEFAPIETKNEIAAYAKDKKALGSVLNEVKELEHSYNKFRNDYKNNLFDPMSPIRGITNSAKDYAGRFLDNKKLKTETADRKTLSSQLNKFVISSERALKGGGVMGPRLIELFKEQQIYPSLENDTPEEFESKLKLFKDEIENSYKAANLSLTHRVRIDPYQLKELEARKTHTEAVDELPIEQETANTNMILMQDSEGNKFEIPANEVQEAVQDGLRAME